MRDECRLACAGRPVEEHAPRRRHAEVGEDLESYLDLEGLVVEDFTKNRQLVNDLFWECGSAEFRFIARSGLFFGGLFGCVHQSEGCGRSRWVVSSPCQE